MVSTKKKPMASRNKASLLHEDRITEKKSKNNILSSISNKFGTPLEEARLSLLENILVEKSIHDDTPFAQIVAISNPTPVQINDFPALQYWWETYRTTDRAAVNQVLRLEQEVIFGSNIISSMSEESLARRQCYGLAEEVEDRIAGLMPQITNDIEVIFPIHDIDASFVQMEPSGLFTLSIMWSFKWVVSKGAKS